jgi:Animal haem peroxidase
MPHGNAERLIKPDQIDLDAVDQALLDGGKGESGTRMGILNDMLGPGHFGKMFPDLPPFRPPDDALTNLGLAMTDVPTAGNSNIPAGFTYLGQFIDHDVTNDPTVGFPFINDVDALHDARTPVFDLDSLYGLGPARQPELYDPGFGPGQARMAIGSTSPVPVPPGVNLPPLPTSMPNDLPRNADKTAIVGDSRNDENLVVAQTHLAFLKFHNAVIQTLPQNADAFQEARRLVAWHYQWIILNDFLPRIAEADVLADVQDHGPQFFNFDYPPFDGEPFMPVEFSVAAYRLGHSMIRDGYNYNRAFNFGGPPAFTGATLDLLFLFTGKGGLPSPLVPGAVNSGIPSNWIIDWRRFHEVEGPNSPLLNFTRAIDTKIALTLFKLPIPSVVSASPNQLAVRNLLRGSRVGLPSAQDVAEKIKVEPLAPAVIANGADGPILKAAGFDEKTPLWYYVLKEAEIVGQGKHLGPLGSRIVAEVFYGLMLGDPNSFKRQRPDWTPTLPAAQPGTFTMADLLRFVNDINPIG